MDMRYTFHILLTASIVMIVLEVKTGTSARASRKNVFNKMRENIPYLRTEKVNMG